MRLTSHQGLDKILLFLLLMIPNMYTTSPFSLYGLQIILFGILAVYIVYRNKNFDLSILLIVMSLVAMLFATSVYHVNYYSDLVYSGVDIIIFKRLILCSFWAILSAFVVEYVFSFNRNDITKILSLVIIIPSLFIITQIIVHYFLGFNFDFSIMTGGIPSRSYYGSYRPSGFMPEPAVYSGQMIALLALFLFFNKKINYVFILGVISIFISQSIAGILLLMLLTGSYILLFSSMKNIIYSLSGFGGVLILASPKLIERYQLFISGKDASNNIKGDAVINFMTNPDIYIFGYGIVGRDNPNLPSYYEALKDLTIFGSSLSIYGVFIGGLFCILLIGLFYCSKLDFKMKIILFIPLLKLCSPSYPLFWLYLCVVLKILLSSKCKENKKSI